MSSATAVNDLPTPTLGDMTRDQVDYRIGPFDKLTVSVFGVSDLSTTGQVDATGNFAMPLLGQVPAVGETPTSLAANIASRLNDKYVRNPQVSVTVAEAVSQMVTVEGSVTRPGQYPVVGRTTLIRMLAAAGGTTEFARLNEAVVFRTVNGQRMVARFNVKDIRGARAPDPQIYGNDVIVLGDNVAKRVFRDVLNAAPLAGVFYQITK